MAKADKMNRGVSAKGKRSSGNEIKLPAGVHAFDSHGNIYASLPELSRVSPKYFPMDQINTALQAGELSTLSADDVTVLAEMVAKK